MGLVAAAAGLAILLSVSLRSLLPQAASDRPESDLLTCSPDVQFLGYSDALNKISFGEVSVAELSGLTYDRQRGVYYAVADRAGATPTHFFTIDIPVESHALSRPTILGVTVLNNALGTPLNGFSFDGEGIVVTPNDELIVASEGGARTAGPEIRRFSLNGAHLGALAVHSHFLIGPNNQSFESLALSPNGHSLFTANEGPLAGDGRTADLRSRIRIVRYDYRDREGFVPAQEHFYLTEPGRTAGDIGVSEMIALSEAGLLVLERGFVEGQGSTIRIFRVSLKGAADVAGEPALSAPGLVPLSKTLMVDLVNCPPSGATHPGIQPNPLLDNFEAMTLGPELPEGRRALLLISDDNANVVQVTRVIALAIRTADLLGGGND